MKYVAVISMTTIRFNIWAMDKADEAIAKGVPVVRRASTQAEIGDTCYMCITTVEKIRGRRWDDIIFLEDWDACLSERAAQYMIDTARALRL